jgi:hypothetical protein
MPCTCCSVNPPEGAEIEHLPQTTDEPLANPPKTIESLLHRCSAVMVICNSPEGDLLSLYKQNGVWFIDLSNGLKWVFPTEDIERAIHEFCRQAGLQEKIPNAE